MDARSVEMATGIMDDWFPDSISGKTWRETSLGCRDAIAAALTARAEGEREECAKVAEASSYPGDEPPHPNSWRAMTNAEIAAAIRSRQTPIGGGT